MAPRARILIVTNGQLSRNPRPLKEARALAAAGHDVTVLMVRNHAGAEACDAALLRTETFRRTGVDLIPGYGTPAAVLFARRARAWVARRAVRRFGRESIHALGPARALLAAARATPAELTIVHNEVPHWVGLKLCRAGRRVAADIEDWHSEDLLPQDRAGRPLRLLREIERGLLHELSYTTTTSHALAGALHGRYGGRKPVPLANAFPLQAAPGPRVGVPPAFFWFSQTLGPGRGLEEFLPAWRAMTEPSRLVLLGEPSGDFAAALVRALPSEQRARVSFHGLVPPDRLPDTIAAFDLGLALEDASIASRDLTITNKILQYLNAGLAIVASDTAGQREVLAQRPEAGIVLPAGPAPERARTLDALVRDPAALQRRKAAARKLAEDVYCWEREAPRLLALVDAALAAKK